MGLYNKEVVRELYVYYIETLRAPLDRKCYPAKQAPVHYVRVRGRRVEIFLPTICCFLYCADIDATRAPLTPDFDYQWKQIKEGDFYRDTLLKETTIRWIHQNIYVDGEGADWVLEPTCVIKKDNLTFAANFI